MRFEARHPGAALLAKATEIGADMLIMGAYSHNRIVERLFGGVTSVMLRACPIAILAAH